ncbi:MAG: Rieske 2Fe-2S domain-containing protein, partial [Gammaproteobacteria bacterium]
AYRNQCPHTGVALNWQEDVFLDSRDELIQCAMHGALFVPETGRCIWGPCQGQVLQKLHAVTDSAGRIYIEAE